MENSGGMTRNRATVQALTATCPSRVKLRRTQYEHMFSALPSNSDIARRSRHVSKVPILLQKSQNAERLIFRERTKQAAIADRCSLKRATEVACEFVAGCSSPPHQYSIAAPTAREILDRWCKKTFATKSAINGSRQPYCMSTRRPSDLRGLHTKNAEVLSISQNAATAPIAYAAMTSS